MPCEAVSLRLLRSHNFVVAFADHYHPIIEEMKLSEDGSTYTVIDNCTAGFELSHANKGFEVTL